MMTATSANPFSTMHPTIAQLHDIAAPDGWANQYHGFDLAIQGGGDPGWVRLCAESDDEDEGYDLHRFTANWTVLWSIRFSARTPFAVVCATIAEALDS